jgi:hypothetical protein
MVPCHEQRNTIVSNNLNISGGIRTLSPNEIEAVAGGLGGYADADSFGDGGLDGRADDRSPRTWGDIIRDTVNKCNDILRKGGGTPA